MARPIDHGFCQRGKIHQLYGIWRSMKDRCSNPKYPGFKNYGARGISVCERWINSFPNFLADMGNRPKGTSIDRINNDGNYDPANCKWSTNAAQMRNRRGTKLNSESIMRIKFLFLFYTQEKVAKEFGISRSHVSAIINRHYWKEAV